MSKRPWIFQSNPFETHTRGSNRKMLTVATDTRSKLQAEIADADILAMFNNLDPVFQAYVLIYTNYSVVFGQRKGKTLNLKNLLNELQDIQLPKWQGLIHAVYPEGTPAEVELFPNSRTPFLHGTYEERINAVQVLHEKVSADAALAAVTPLVLSFYNLLITARDTQQQKEGLKGQLSASRDSQRVLLADELYRVLGGMMVKFYNERAHISHYFDLSLLRNTNQLTQIRQIANVVAAGASNTEGVLEEEAVQATITVLSGGPIEFGITLDGSTFIGETIVVNAADGTVEFPFEDVPAGALILVKNLNNTEASGYQVEIYA